ncbi:MAG: alcohol dehydrogenase catalytic domain-containing protein, partial [Sandaracinobacteroides sp.]
MSDLETSEVDATPVAGAPGDLPAAMSRTMRAAQMTGFRSPLQISDVPVASPGVDGALVQIEASGVCRSDWHMWNEDWTWVGMKIPLPTVLGHEIGGIVV